MLRSAAYSLKPFHTKWRNQLIHHFTPQNQSADNIKEMMQKMEQEKARYLEESKNTSKILLHGPPHIAAFNCLNLSPFTTKLQSFFTYYNIEYEAKLCLGMRSTAHKKLPFISYKGKEYGDSQLIMDMLCNERNIDIDKYLNEKQKAISFAFRIATQDKLYWIELYRRFHINNYQSYLSIFIPNKQLMEILKDNIKSQLWSQGTGRFDENTVYSMYEQHINGIIQYIDNNKFFFGDNITSIDFTIYALLSGMYALPQITWGNQQNHLILENQVRQYLNRFEIQVWSQINGWKNHI